MRDSDPMLEGLTCGCALSPGQGGHVQNCGAMQLLGCICYAITQYQTTFSISVVNFNSSVGENTVKKKNNKIKEVKQLHEVQYLLMGLFNRQ